jgi:protein-tyrosine phosphatase
MDRSNRDALLAKAPKDHRHKIRLMRDFDPQTSPEAEPEVPDPYYGSAQGFDRVFEMLHRSCVALLDKLEKEIDAGGPRA